jgi:protein-S-isoprenylcysteine O-methyltransferase Ste14
MAAKTVNAGGGWSRADSELARGSRAGFARETGVLSSELAPGSGAGLGTARANLQAFAFRYRNRLAALPLIYAFLSTRWEYEVNWVIWPVAAGLCLGGAALRAWARWHNAYAQGRRKTLVKTGPYALVRNPLYIGNALIIAGAGVASELEWFLPVVIVWAFLVFAIACGHEETRLRAKYGPAYEAYRAEVPGWWPRALPSESTRIKAGGFWMVLATQVVYSSLALVPFLIKELNPLGLWPHP